MIEMKKVLSIAGSDCSGGAGIEADLKTFSANGVFGMSVIVSVVAENTARVIDIQDVTPDMIEKQIDAVFEDIIPDAVKIGMLSTPECMKAVARKLRQYQPSNVVIDPVMYAKNGCPLMNPMSVQALIQHIIPLADVLTPNIPEAEVITGMKILSITDMEEAAHRIYEMGCHAVIVKGGHYIGDAMDVLFDGKKFSYYKTKRINTKNTHGTGCTFSSAIATGLAKGYDVKRAVEKAKEYVTMAIEHSLPLGKGNGPTNHFYEVYKHGLKNQDYTLYLVTDQKAMSTETLDEAVEQAIRGGCTMVQLRESYRSDKELCQISSEIKKITDTYEVPLIINNRIDIALATDAAGVHVGQGDLSPKKARELLGKDKILGVSVTCLEEAQKAVEAGADYLGVGAMFATNTKQDAKLVSMEELEKIRKEVSIPIVVIGGINKENAGTFNKMGVDGLAVVSAIIGQPDIRQAAKELKSAFYMEN